MGNAISDSRKFRRGVDATLSEPTAEGVDRVLHLLGQHPHQMIYKDRESWSIFVKLAQAGSIEGLRFALSLARCASQSVTVRRLSPDPRSIPRATAR